MLKGWPPKKKTFLQLLWTSCEFVFVLLQLWVLLWDLQLGINVLVIPLEALALQLLTQCNAAADVPNVEIRWAVVLAKDGRVKVLLVVVEPHLNAACLVFGDRAGGAIGKAVWKIFVELLEVHPEHVPNATAWDELNGAPALPDPH